MREADAVREVFDGLRLAQARHMQSQSKKELAEAVGISPAAIGQFEGGVTRPRSETLTRLAEALEVPVRFFAFQADRPRAQLGVGDAHFRSLRSTRSFERERAVAYAAQLWEITAYLERLVRLPKVDVPALDDLGGVPADPVAAARGVRASWGLGIEPIGHMVRLLESKGVVVSLLPFSVSKRVQAFSTSKLGRPVVILTRDRDDVYKHRFSAAHELGHLVMHSEARPGDVAAEREADRFAAEFLTPQRALAPLLPRKADFRRYAELQAEWGVEIESLIYRSGELGILSDATYRRAFQRLNALRGDAGLFQPRPIDSYVGETPTLTRKAFELAMQRGASVHDVATALGVYREALTQYGLPGAVDADVVYVDFARGVGAASPNAPEHTSELHPS